MKVFVYKCSECGKRAEVKPADKPPMCHGKEMVRDYSGIGFIFKGYEFVGDVYHEKRDR